MLKCCRPDDAFFRLCITQREDTKLHFAPITTEWLHSRGVHVLTELSPIKNEWMDEDRTYLFAVLFNFML